MLGGVVNYLLTKGIKISDQNEWLEQCYSCCTSGNPHITSVKVNEFVYEQWMLANLRDIGESCIPRNISEIQKTVLSGKYALQVDSFFNVGESSYSQLQKIRNTVNKNLNVEGPSATQVSELKAGRMLKLTLTDGVSIIYGMEYKPIPVLRDPLIPGIKVIITGPVECRRGVLLLEPAHVQVLGGESDDLLVCNAVENILARRLNLEENPTPYKDVVVPTTQSHTDNDTFQITPIPNHSTLRSNDNAIPIDLIDSDDDMLLCDHVEKIENTYSQANSLDRSSAETRIAEVYTVQNITSQSNRLTTCVSSNVDDRVISNLKLPSVQSETKSLEVPLTFREMRTNAGLNSLSNENTKIITTVTGRSSSKRSANSPPVHSGTKSFKSPTAVSRESYDSSANSIFTRDNNSNTTRRKLDDNVMDMYTNIGSSVVPMERQRQAAIEDKSRKISCSLDSFDLKNNFKICRSIKNDVANEELILNNDSGIVVNDKRGNNDVGISYDTHRSGSVNTNVQSLNKIQAANIESTSANNIRNMTSSPVISKLSDVVSKSASNALYNNIEIRLYGYVKKFTSNPRIRDNSWKLTAIISDDTANLEISFCNNFLADIFGYTSAQMIAEKDIASKDPALQQKVLQIIKQGRTKLLSLRGQIKIKFLDNGELPIVSNITA